MSIKTQDEKPFLVIRCVLCFDFVYLKILMVVLCVNNLNISRMVPIPIAIGTIEIHSLKDTPFKGSN
jgi:hypothetical protein